MLPNHATIATYRYKRGAQILGLGLQLIKLLLPLATTITRDGLFGQIGSTGFP